MRSRAAIIVVAVVVTLVTTTVVGHILSRFDIGPYWVEYQSPSGIPYQCMFQSKQDWIDVTLEQNEVHYHAYQEN